MPGRAGLAAGVGGYSVRRYRRAWWAYSCSGRRRLCGTGVPGRRRCRGGGRWRAAPGRQRRPGASVDLSRRAAPLWSIYRAIREGSTISMPAGSLGAGRPGAVVDLSRRSAAGVSGAARATRGCSRFIAKVGGGCQRGGEGDQGLWSIYHEGRRRASAGRRRRPGASVDLSRGAAPFWSIYRAIREGSTISMPGGSLGAGRPGAVVDLSRRTAARVSGAAKATRGFGRFVAKVGGGCQRGGEGDQGLRSICREASTPRSIYRLGATNRPLAADRTAGHFIVPCGGHPGYVPQLPVGSRR